MKRVLFFLGALVVLGAVGLSMAWMGRANLAAQYLANHLHVPVTIQSLTLSKTEADLTGLWIGNPRRSTTSTAFAAEQIAIVSTLSQIRGNPLIIDEIAISNILVGIEFYPDGHTNWGIILGGGAPEQKTQGRDYLIRTLVLTNLTIEVTDAQGQKKRYPTLARMEFHNISSETGFPISEIEKAIFNQMMKNILQQFNLQNLFKQLPIPKGSPLQYLPF